MTNLRVDLVRATCYVQPMQRIPEPELMVDNEQAAAYAQADFEAPHSRFITLFQETFPDWHGRGHILDLGCGPGDIARRFALAYPDCDVDGVDGAAAMLAVGKIAIESDPACAGRIRLVQACLPHDRPPRPDYDAVISNSLLHHLHEPAVLWQAVAAYAKPGAPVFIIDLMRPETREEARRLTDLYTQGEPDVLRRDFFNSLLAAFTVEEIQEQLRQAGLAHLKVRAISDRHIMVHGAR